MAVCGEYCYRARYGGQQCSIAITAGAAYDGCNMVDTVAYNAAVSSLLRVTDRRKELAHFGHALSLQCAIETAAAARLLPRLS